MVFCRADVNVNEDETCIDDTILRRKEHMRQDGSLPGMKSIRKPR